MAPRRDDGAPDEQGEGPVWTLSKRPRSPGPCPAGGQRNAINRCSPLVDGACVVGDRPGTRMRGNAKLEVSHSSRSMSYTPVRGCCAPAARVLDDDAAVAASVPALRRQGYEGDTVASVPHGRGSYEFPNPHFRYQGDFKQGVPHGGCRSPAARGTALARGSSYPPQRLPPRQAVASSPSATAAATRENLSTGVRCGAGAPRLARNDRLSLEPEIEGQGVRRWADGATYMGTFHCGEFNGEGTMTSPSGHRYEGQWKLNQHHGSSQPWSPYLLAHCLPRRALRMMLTIPSTVAQGAGCGSARTAQWSRASSSTTCPTGGAWSAAPTGSFATATGGTAASTGTRRGAARTAPGTRATGRKDGGTGGGAAMTPCRGSST